MQQRTMLRRSRAVVQLSEWTLQQEHSLQAQPPNQLHGLLYADHGRLEVSTHNDDGKRD